jgi:hypothetical protein
MYTMSGYTHTSSALTSERTRHIAVGLNWYWVVGIRPGRSRKVAIATDPKREEYV